MLSIRTAAILAVSAGAILFFSGMISKESKALYEEATLNQIINEKRENFNDLQVEFKTVKDDLVNMKAVVPSEKNIFEVVRLFESLSKNSGGTSTIIFGDPVDKDGEFKEVPFHITANGTLEFFEKYLKKLEDLPYGIKFSSTNIIGSAGVYNNAEMKLEATVMFRSE